MAHKFAHIELSTNDVVGAKKFYAKVFDWKIVDLPDGSYSMINVGQRGAIGGGLQKKQMPEAPTAWMPYVEVESVRRTLAKAAKNGACVMVDHTPIGDMGAIGIFVDATGASLGVWQAKKQSAKKKLAKRPARK